MVSPTELLVALWVGYPPLESSPMHLDTPPQDQDSIFCPHKALPYFLVIVLRPISTTTVANHRLSNLNLISIVYSNHRHRCRLLFCFHTDQVQYNYQIHHIIRLPFFVNNLYLLKSLWVEV